tara:strand:- start:242 stop:484 length:243 start_codon:yes stop_codon:yes gene_type:complete
MSKRCKLQKEYYKEFGNYKGSGKYTDHYVNWLESKVLAINYTHSCESDSELLFDFLEWFNNYCTVDIKPNKEDVELYLSK